MISQTIENPSQTSRSQTKRSQTKRSQTKRSQTKAPKSKSSTDTAASAKKPAVKGRRDPGRDEALSEYLASLGGIPLLSADEEKEYARNLRDAETLAWRLLAADTAAMTYLVGHPTLDHKKFLAGDALSRHARRLQRASDTGPRLTKAVKADILEITSALREFDDDRTLVMETIDVVQSNLGNASGGPALEAVRQQRVDDARAARKKALRIRNQFVRSNLRLVVSVARRFHHYRMPLIDLIQEGNLGLIKSVHRFDDRRGFRFSTYAHWWIRQAIERAIMNKGAQVRLPVHIFDARREVAKASHDLSQAMGRDPSKEELAIALGQTVERIEEIMKAVPREPVSLDDPVGDDEDRTVSETISDKNESTPDEKVISVDQASHLRNILRRLSPMEIDIIERRFGLIDDANETLEQIGKSYNLSRERVRQIQVQGLRKMMRFCERRQLAV